MKIQGGNNPHSTVSVNTRGELLARTTSEPRDKSANREGQVWSIYFEQLAGAGTPYIFYFKNTSTTLLNVTDVRISTDTANTSLLYVPVAGTPTPTNPGTPQITQRNAAINKTLIADAQVAESFAGLTQGGVYFFEKLPVIQTRYKLTTTSNIILGQGDAFAIQSLTAAATLTGLVSIVEELA